MAEPVKNDILSRVMTMGGKALLGAVIGAAAAAALGGAIGALMAATTLGAPVAGGIAGALFLGYFGGITGAQIGGAAGAVVGLNQTVAEDRKYDELLHKRSQARNQDIGRDAAFQEGAMAMAAETQPMLAAERQKGRQEVMQYVEQQMQGKDWGKFIKDQQEAAKNQQHVKS